MFLINKYIKYNDFRFNKLYQWFKNYRPDLKRVNRFRALLVMSIFDALFIINVIFTISNIAGLQKINIKIATILFVIPVINSLFLKHFNDPDDFQPPTENISRLYYRILIGYMMIQIPWLLINVSLHSVS